jgi:hypothetical protein
MVCRVRVNIGASAETVWSLLIDAGGYPRWNSTVTAIDGRIREGSRIKIHVPGTKQTFTPTVSGVVPHQRMVWSNGIAGVFKGVRGFKLQSRPDSSTDFEMEERFSGLVFALTKKMLPDFRPIFEAYANDLKLEAQRLTHVHEPRYISRGM